MRGAHSSLWHGFAIASCVALGALFIRPAAAQKAGSFSGTLEAAFSGLAKLDYAKAKSPVFSYGIEEYSNLRYKAPIGDSGSFNAAVNLILLSGSKAESYRLAYLRQSVSQAAAIGQVPGISSYYSLPFYSAEGFVGAIELERLYFKAGFEAVDLEAGLMRLAMGYGLLFSPTDFLSERNPLLAEARPKGAPSLAFSFYPLDTWKIKVFAQAPQDPLDGSGWGSVFGMVQDIHFPALSLETMYSLLLPERDPSSDLAEIPASVRTNYVHLFGLCLKAEAEIGLFLDSTFRLDLGTYKKNAYYGKAFNWLRGLEASAGADYSFFDGNLYLAMQYLFNGPGYLDSGENLDVLYSGQAGSWSDLAPTSRSFRTDIPIRELNRKNYLSVFARYAIDEKTYASFSCLASLDDLSLLPSIAFESELFQGFTLRLSGRMPLDPRRLSGTAEHGEFGPVHLGSCGEGSLSARMKF